MLERALDELPPLLTDCEPELDDEERREFAAMNDDEHASQYGELQEATFDEAMDEARMWLIVAPKGWRRFTEAAAAELNPRFLPRWQEISGADTGKLGL